MDGGMADTSKVGSNKVGLMTADEMSGEVTDGWNNWVRVTLGAQLGALACVTPGLIAW